MLPFCTSPNLMGNMSLTICACSSAQHEMSGAIADEIYAMLLAQASTPPLCRRSAWTTRRFASVATRPRSVLPASTASAPR